MADDEDETTLSRLGRELAFAEQAVRQPGTGAIGNLECRLADLQVRFLTTPARSLGDLEAKLHVVRGLVASLGSRGYLLDLVESTIADVRSIAAQNARPANDPD
ncbi:MAG: hypothetical protein IPK66_09330 [Rhodospirillales bacterium]|nr:hypothetical protein [Rhodospirillales bacterium]